METLSIKAALKIVDRQAQSLERKSQKEYQSWRESYKKRTGQYPLPGTLYRNNC